MKKLAPLALLFALLFSASAAAQWQVPSGCLPVGKGVGVTGFSSGCSTPGILQTLSGGTGSSSALTLQSTSGSGTTDSILFKTGTQVSSWTMETPPGSNTYTPSAGSVPGILATRAGTACATTGIFTTPGIGPAPSSGQLFTCGDYADSTSGNISNIFSIAYNSGTRLTAGVTGIAQAPAGASGTEVWGGQFSARAIGNAGGILQGANIEADFATGSVTAIALTLKLGNTGGDTTTNPGNAYINFLADTGKTPTTGLRFQSSAFTSTNTQNILNVEGGSAVNGINLSSMTLTGSAFKSSGFDVAGSSIGIGTSAVSTSRISTVDENTDNTTTFTKYLTAIQGARFLGRHARGSLASPTATAANDELSALFGAGYQTTTGAFTNPTAAVRLMANEAYTSTAQGSFIALEVIANGSTTRLEAARFDRPATATQTGMMLYDVDNNTVERVTVGAADSGGAGFKVLRIPN